MTTVTVHQAKTHLSKLLRRVATGEEVVISRSGKAVARLVPLDLFGPRILGGDADVVHIADDFDAELPPDLLDHFEK